MNTFLLNIFIDAYTNYMDKCTCSSCQQIETLRLNDIWVHIGSSSSYTKDINYQKFSIQQDKTLSHLSKLDNFFERKKTDLGSSFKPINSIWFSHGGWLSNPYHDNEEHFSLDGARVEAVQNPQNVLRISTLDELKKFDEEYNAYDFIYETSFFRKKMDSIYKPFYQDDVILERNPSSINWNKVKEDYAGIAIDFCKVKELSNATYEDHMYLFWHCAWDVESLVVWDMETAFGNQVYPLELCE